MIYRYLLKEELIDKIRILELKNLAFEKERTQLKEEIMRLRYPAKDSPEKAIRWIK